MTVYLHCEGVTDYAVIPLLMRKVSDIKKYHEVYDAINSEFQGLKEKIGFYCLAIVPKEMIESWLLADENAYPFVPKNPKLPSKPEDLWDKPDDLNHPYKYLFLLHHELPNSLPHRKSRLR